MYCRKWNNYTFPSIIGGITFTHSLHTTPHPDSSEEEGWGGSCDLLDFLTLITSPSFTDTEFWNHLRHSVKQNECHKWHFIKQKAEQVSEVTFHQTKTSCLCQLKYCQKHDHHLSLFFVPWIQEMSPLRSTICSIIWKILRDTLWLTDNNKNLYLSAISCFVIMGLLTSSLYLWNSRRSFHRKIKTYVSGTSEQMAN